MYRTMFQVRKRYGQLLVATSAPGQRLVALHSEARSSREHISRLYARIDNLIEQRSVEVDDDLDITEEYSS